ncbi:translocation/assembly module TamB domain-containing protein [Lutibaculum baratangense]|uniref:Translocation and assembly module TamB C-terminal domain-containing protein n=1 Tax=Lutibaculum baratangense AMV1 TaxID=631454 RepID=V4RJJ9_9HYPH|nr:translocation/assembly module TamB domain-containing protein [Lutibaculum baratangense]ESR23410.1 hypothetical protein N177_3478 [Lutibaculum baratangense AMV1]
MVRYVLGFVFLGLAILVGWQTIADAQEENERSRFVRFVERQISTPDRQIRLGAIDGALSSDVTISSITIADREGVWLTIENAHLVWSRLALLRGRLDIDLLEADRIEIARTPNAPEEEIPEEAQFEIPELPVGVDIDEMNVPRIDIAAGVIGPAVSLSVTGELHLNDGSLDSNLEIERLDEPGSLVLEASFSNETRVLGLNLRLSEPENGVVANALNIPDRPALSFSIEGTGPLDAFEADISLSANDEQLVDGTATISQTGAGLRFVADVDGNLQPLVPPLYQDLVQGGSNLAIDVTRADSGAISVRRAEITSGVASVQATAEVAADGFPTALDADVRLGSDEGNPVALPGGGGEATVQSGTISITLGGDVENTWVARFDLNQLNTPLLSAERAQIMGSGLAANMADAENRRITFEVSGSATGLTSNDRDVARALGGEITLSSRGNWSSGQPVDVQVARIENPNANASFEGRIDGDGLRGDYALQAQNLGLFSGLVGQDLGGAVDVTASGLVGLSGAELDLTLQGRGTNLELGIPALDGLFAGETSLEGGIARSDTGFRFEELRLSNPQVEARVHGAYGSEAANLVATVEVDDIAALSDRASGSVSVEAMLTGNAERPEIAASVNSDRLVLNGKPLTGLDATFEGALTEGTYLNGDLAVSASLDGVPVEAQAGIASLEDGSRVLQDLTARAGRATASGNLTLRPDGLYEGAISLDAPDLATIAPLFLADASGSLQADVNLSVVGEEQSAAIEASANRLRFNTIEVGSASVDLTGSNLFQAPMLEGEATASAVRVGGYVLDSLQATATRSGDTTSFDVTADLAEGALAASGTLAPVESGFDVVLSTLRLSHQDIVASLRSEARVAIRDGEIAIESADLGIGGGGVTLAGTIGDELDLSAVVQALPLSLANAFVPDLALGGEVSGRLEATGTTASPVADFQLTGRGITAAPLRDAGISALSIETAGQFRDGTVELTLDTNVGGGTVNVEGSIGETLDVTARINGLPVAIANAFVPDLGLGGSLSGTARATGSLDNPDGTFDATIVGLTADVLRQANAGPLSLTANGRVSGRTLTLETARLQGGGISATAQGTVPLEGQGLNVRVELQNLPLAIANAFAPDLGLRGSLTGTATATGSIDNPAAAFNVRGQGLSATPLREAGIAAVSVAVDGRFENQTVILQSASAEGSGVTLRAQGRVPLSGEGLDVAVQGNIPLTLSDQLLAERGARLSGAIAVDARVVGSIQAPRFSGSLTADGVSFIDPDSGLRLTNGRLRASLTGEQAVIDELSASLGNGRVSVTGTIGIDPASSFPADLRITLRDARYEDPQLIAATLTGDLTLQGPLLGEPTLAGVVTIDRAEITVPERFGGSTALIDVRHVNTPADVLNTLQKADLLGGDEPRATRGNQPGGILLDLTINAPNQIFVRGRGLDAELGGSVRLTGPVSNISPVGSFEMIRGRIDILGQRITFDRGLVTLYGDLDPYLDFVATTETDTVTITLSVQGRASDPDITFSSNPDLPQDEVLAQLLFGRSINDLSALQIAQLASAAAQLAGGGGPSILQQLRATTGLDDLDIVTQEGGGAAVQAGRYIDENIYLGVTAGEEESGVSVNLDITGNLKIRGEATTRDSSIGLFYEREY